jgi:hypothetical protein
MMDPIHERRSCLMCRVVHRHDIVPHVAYCCKPGCLKTSTCPFHHSTEVRTRSDALRFATHLSIFHTCTIIESTIIP